MIFLMQKQNEKASKLFEKISVFLFPHGALYLFDREFISIEHDLSMFVILLSVVLNYLVFLF